MGIFKDSLDIINKDATIKDSYYVGRQITLFYKTRIRMSIDKIFKRRHNEQEKK